MCDHSGCSHQQTVPSVQQTLDELDFERGIWTAVLWDFQSMSENYIELKAKDLVLKYNKDLQEDLEDELQSLKKVYSTNFGHEHPTPLELLNHLYKTNLANMFPNLCITLRIVLSIPATVASAEQSFSTVKNVLRSSMHQQRLSSLGVLAVEVQLTKTINMNEVINDFAARNSRRKKPCIFTFRTSLVCHQSSKDEHVVALDGDEARVRQLLTRGTCVDARDNAGYTALHYAARKGNVSLCRLLLNAGASVNATTKAGLATPLHRAAMAGQLEVTELLVRSGADCLMKDAEGRTAADRAQDNNQEPVLKFLNEQSN